jgi:hypothetical protein
MPDYPLKTMRNVIQLIYSGSAYLSCEADAESLKETLASLEIQVEECLSTKKSSRSRSAVQEPIRLTRKLLKKLYGKDEEIQEIGVTDDSSSIQEIKTSLSKGKKRKQQTMKHNKEMEEYATESDGSDLFVEMVRKKKPKKKCVSKSPSKKPEKCKEETKKSETMKGRSKPIKDSDSAPEDPSSSNEWKEPDYLDKEWFDEQARKCQYCKKEFDNPAHGTNSKDSFV